MLDRLARLAPQIDGTFSRYVYPPGPPARDHETSVAIRLRYEGGDVHCTPATPDPAGTPNPSVQPAAASLDVTVDFMTADGLFAETFTAACRSTGETLTFEGTVPLARIEGSFRSLAADASGSASADVRFFGQLYPGSEKYSNGGVTHGRPFGYVRAR